MATHTEQLSHRKKSALWDWLTTVDHKKIAILYCLAGLFFFILGGIEAVLIRIQLLYPEFSFVSAQTFNELITMHGTTMIFLAAMPIFLGLMNAVVPLQIGARDVAFPFMNALGLWLFIFGGLLLNMSWFLGGAPDAGWTAYAPLSTDYAGTSGMDYYVLGLQIAGFGTLMGGINFLVTVINMRAPGMSFMRMPMFTWASFITSALILFAFPPLTIGFFLLMFDRFFGSNFFVADAGGNVIVWEHIFWIFGHPEVYILILPAFGILSEVIPTFSRKRLFGYSAMVFATALIAFLGFMVWAHHMFTTGLGPVANSIFAIATMTIAIPTGVKIFNWLFTMWGGQLRFPTANLWAVGFIPSFLIGGMTGIMLSVAPADYQYHDTYFVVAHFHYVIVGGSVFGIFAGLYYWWPRMFSKTLNETLGKWHFWTFFIGFHFTFFPQHFLGLMGMPRRVFTYLSGQNLEAGNFVSTIGAFLMGVGTIIFIVNIIMTQSKKEVAAYDPWDGRTLEWAIPIPTPEYNFAQLPLVKGLDAFWIEKMNGNKVMTPAEPLDDVHMPNGSILPLLMSLSFFVAAFGFIFDVLFVAILGLASFFFCMLLRSVIDDHGYHIHKEELIPVENKGGKA
ncbi:cytochrome c oxidase subunit I [Pueribacillus theae]|uniref:Cytochrome c oxidase subunit 1 n=1 Tax=Pueribacillus theae TaxID=2171751 RepID=A0A2U1K846_9BACI|nr:cytochrome c oxidase subunit I [Pueribacillus theae]PWA13379.1 cytochrome c oxidase subunit I [Pueribacillus theae]